MVIVSGLRAGWSHLRRNWDFVSPPIHPQKILPSLASHKNSVCSLSLLCAQSLIPSYPRVLPRFFSQEPGLLQYPLLARFTTQPVIRILFTHPWIFLFRSGPDSSHNRGFAILFCFFLIIYRSSILVN